MQSICAWNQALGLTGDRHNYVTFEASVALNQHKQKDPWSVGLFWGTLHLFVVPLGWLSTYCSEKNQISQCVSDQSGFLFREPGAEWRLVRKEVHPSNLCKLVLAGVVISTEVFQMHVPLKMGDPHVLTLLLFLSWGQCHASFSEDVSIEVCLIVLTGIKCGRAALKGQAAHALIWKLVEPQKFNINDNN